jgi:hypothetical protein
MASEVMRITDWLIFVAARPMRHVLNAQIVKRAISACESAPLQRPSAPPRPREVPYSWTVRGLVGSPTWMMRYLTGLSALGLRDTACKAPGGS